MADVSVTSKSDAIANGNGISARVEETIQRIERMISEHFRVEGDTVCLLGTELPSGITREDRDKITELYEACGWSVSWTNRLLSLA